MTVDTTDRILDLIDNGLQSSSEVGMELAEPGWCTRCTRFPVADDSEFCPTCRAYLLGDINEPRSEFTDAMNALVQRAVGTAEELSMDVLLYGNAYTDLTTGERVDPTTVVRRSDNAWQPVGENGEPVRWVAGLPVVFDESYTWTDPRIDLDAIQRDYESTIDSDRTQFRFERRYDWANDDTMAWRIHFTA